MCPDSPIDDDKEARRSSAATGRPAGAADARRAAARAAAELVAPGMQLGLGSGRAVWATLEEIAARLGGDAAAVVCVCASPRTEEVAEAAGLAVLPLMATTELELVLDGADEVTASLDLLKGAGGAMLRERLVVASGRRFVVVAEHAKLVGRLGEGRRLPVEIVRFGAAATVGRLTGLLGDPELRLEGDGNPFVTADGHLVVDAEIPPDAAVAELHERLLLTPGVADDGLFLGLAHAAILGRDDGTVVRLGD